VRPTPTIPVTGPRPSSPWARSADWLAGSTSSPRCPSCCGGGSAFGPTT